ncbi:Uncharacterised protein [Yersinia enterocolitica]|nr:Uncharacterised protein [Yersinia enterocolitica]
MIVVSLNLTSFPAATVPEAVPTFFLAASPKPRFKRAAGTFVKSDRLLSLSKEAVIRGSSPAATVPTVVPTLRTAAPPSPRLVRAVDVLCRSDKLADFWSAPVINDDSLEMMLVPSPIILTDPPAATAIPVPPGVLHVTLNEPVQLLTTTHSLRQDGNIRLMFAVSTPARVIRSLAACSAVRVTFAAASPATAVVPYVKAGTHPVSVPSVFSGLAVFASVVFSQQPVKVELLSTAPFGYPEIDELKVESNTFNAPALAQRAKLESS